MGITPLFRPNTGMNTKLFSLKYTPNTVAAVSLPVVYVMRMMFISQVMMEPIAIMMTDGKPMA